MILTMILTMALSLAPLFVPVALAMPWAGPTPTLLGLIATAGMSPRPTKAPIPDFLPGELRRRQDVPFPPPDNWCGFINSEPSFPLSCSSGYTCVNSGAAVGCCTATSGICTNLYTTCSNWFDDCGSACQADPGIKKCNSAFPYCGAYSFDAETSLFNCQSTVQFDLAVEFLNDYYATAIGSTIGSDSSAVVANTGQVSLGSAAAAASTSGVTDVGGDVVASEPNDFSVPTISFPSFSEPTYSFATPTITPINYGSGSSGDTYYTRPSSSGRARRGGIAGGISGAAVLIGAFVWFFIARRKKQRLAQSQQGNFANAQGGPAPAMPPAGTPMEQSNVAFPPKAFGGYETAPPLEEPKLYPQYPSPPMEQSQPGPPSYFAPPAAADGLASSPPTQANGLTSSPPPLASSPPPQPRGSGTFPPPSQGPTSPPPEIRHSAAPSVLSAPSSDAGHSYYVPPTSPGIREVDGTLGNPGIPSPVPAHGQPMEVDATLGNPSAPVGGHGIPAQGAPGGSPSSTELSGNPVRASLNAPFTTGPYEMPHSST